MWCAGALGARVNARCVCVHARCVCVHARCVCVHARCVLAGIRHGIENQMPDFS